MSAEDLYKKLLNREDLEAIPIAHIVTVACAVVEEITGGEDDE